jgi:hypothetical protein
MTIKIGGSLIVAVPMRSAVVVSAESRRLALSANGSSYVINGVQKIHSLMGRDDLVFFATGTILITGGLTASMNVDKQASTNVIRYDVISVLADYLTVIAPPIIDADFTRKTA